MGMVSCLFRVDTNDLEQMLENSSVLDDKLDIAMDEKSPELIDLDKSWEAIFYMLTGYGIEKIEKAEPPFSWALFSGQTVDEDQDLGYGPGHYITAEQVKVVDAALQKITDDDMKDRFDGKKMMQENIYPLIWNEPETIEYILENFQTLKEFYAEAAKRSQAVITFLN